MAYNPKNRADLGCILALLEGIFIALPKWIWSKIRRKTNKKPQH
jgi:hypothetical protein